MDWDDDEDDEPEPEGDGVEPIDDESEGDPLYTAPLLSVAEERALFTRYAETHEQAVRDRLILANTRLVRAIARKYRPRGAMVVADIESEGRIGLMRAIEKYEVTSGNKFSTMATWWIRQAINRALEDRSEMVREPNYVQHRRRKALREGRESEMAPAAVVLSLDAPAGRDPANDPLREFIASEAPDVAERVVERVFWRETLYVALERLTARQRLVIALRYGLGDDGEPLTLEECGRLLGVTRERVRQIEAKALTQLRLWLRETADGDVALRMLTLVEQTRTTQIRKAAAAQRAQTKQKKRPTKQTKQTKQTSQTSRVA